MCHLIICCINVPYNLALCYVKTYSHSPVFNFVFQYPDFFLSTCTITIPINYESVMKLLWKTNVLNLLIRIMLKLFTYQYSSNRCAKVGCLLGDYSAKSQNHHAPRQEVQFFLLEILVHLHRNKEVPLSLLPFEILPFVSRLINFLIIYLP